VTPVTGTPARASSTAWYLCPGALSRATAVAAAVSLAGATVAPLIQLAAQGRNVPEVSVIEHAAALLLHHGSPYALTAQQALTGLLRYDPYLPVMTIFGLPHALAGGGVLTDPRLWAGGAFAGLIALAPRVQRARPAGWTGVLLARRPAGTERRAASPPASRSQASRRQASRRQASRA
jgi:hypothetical protein